MRNLLVLALLSGAAFSAAQASLPQFEVSYFQSDSINLNGGGSGRLQGINLGVSQSLISLPLFGDARVGFTYMLNGGIGGGGSADGNIWRLYAAYTSPMAGPNGIYGLGGIFYANATSRNNSFQSESGFGFHVGLGVPISTPGSGMGVPGVPKAALEFKYFYGSKSALRGFSIGAIVRF
jgi:hypothetical protein